MVVHLHYTVYYLNQLEVRKKKKQQNPEKNMGVELDEREVEETISKRKDLFFPDERHPRGRD